MAQPSGADDHDVLMDDFIFWALMNEEGEEVEFFPISDEKYAQQLQFQEVLMASLLSSNLLVSSSSSSMKFLMNPFQYSESEVESKIQKEAGESSQSFCEICMEGKPAGEMFSNKTICCHSYCRDCMGKHVASKIQENVNLVKCPDLNCQAVLEPNHCRSIVPDEVLDRWSTSLCDSLILSSRRFHCPFKDCSGVMLVDDEGEGEGEGEGEVKGGGAIVMESECPCCHRLFCAQCKVPWHSEIACEEFQRLDKNDTTREDLMAVELANKLKWKRCPQCKFFVERRDGCLHITCRCGFQFCYGCGSRWGDTHESSCLRV